MMVKEYDEIPDYEAKHKKIKDEIKRLRNDKDHRYGGSVVHLHETLIDLEKNHVFAKTQSLAKKQNKEKIVNRMIKNAEKYRLLNKFEKQSIFEDAFSGAFWSGIAAAVGLYTSVPLVVVGGAAAAAYCVAYGMKKGKDLSQAKSDYRTLKNYAKTGDLKQALKKADERNQRVQSIFNIKANKMFDFMLSKKER